MFSPPKGKPYHSGFLPQVQKDSASLCRWCVHVHVDQTPHDASQSWKQEEGVLGQKLGENSESQCGSSLPDCYKNIFVKVGGENIFYLTS